MLNVTKNHKGKLIVDYVLLKLLTKILKAIELQKQPILMVLQSAMLRKKFKNQ
jgi:hypothetical protein